MAVTMPEATELDEALQALAREVIAGNRRALVSDRRGRRVVFYLLVLGYVALLTLGLVALAAAVVEALDADRRLEFAAAGALALFSGLAFFGLYLLRPLHWLERHSIVSTWLAVVTTTYWARLERGGDAEAATAEALRRLTALYEKHAAEPGQLIEELGPYARAWRQAEPTAAEPQPSKQ